MDISQEVKAIISGASHVVSHEELVKKLSLDRKLRVKLGVDPTTPDLHLGHAVALLKLKVFQELGHEVIFLIGDFTARIGDPTGRSQTRPPLTEKEVQYNIKTYFDQVSKILDVEKIVIAYNSKWLSAFSASDFVQLCSKVTVARVIERDDFQKRLQEHTPIGMNELLYPLLQGYDSVALQADVELGGTDQLFNNLMGRTLQEQYGQEPQVVITLPLLEGTDGIRKMSKSYNYAISFNESADQAYGKLMSISDVLMWRYFELLLFYSSNQIKSMKEQVINNTVHPMDLKKQMAHAIISKWWSPQEADNAQKQFENLFQKKDYSDAQLFIIPYAVDDTVWIVDLLKMLQVVRSSSQAKSLLQAGAVAINGEEITDFKAQISIQDNMLVKAGKHRIYRLKKNNT